MVSIEPEVSMTQINDRIGILFGIGFEMFVAQVVLMERARRLSRTCNVPRRRCQAGALENRLVLRRRQRVRSTLPRPSLRPLANARIMR